MVKITTKHEDALIDAIQDAENHADSLIDPADILEQADRLSEVLDLVRSIIKEGK